MSEMAGEDASLDAAVALISKKISPDDVGLAPTRTRDTRENRDDRDPIEKDDYHDLHDLEAAEREAKRANDGKEPQTKGDAEGDEGQEAEAEDDAFIEFPPAEDGAEPERVPVKEALEAVQKLRQMNGDIATAITQAEREYHEQQDAAYSEIVQMHEAVRSRAEMALRIIPAPQPPDVNLRNPNSPTYDPERYAYDMAVYEQQSAGYRQLQQQMQQAKADGDKAAEAARAAAAQREHERMVRYMPDWADDTKRGALQTKLTEGMQKHFGIKPDDPLLEHLPFDHRLVRMANIAIEALSKPEKQVEVRKQVQAKAPRIVNGRLPERDPKGTGRFVSDARKELAERGTEDAFAKLLMRSGALKGL